MDKIYYDHGMQLDTSKLGYNKLVINLEVFGPIYIDLNMDVFIFDPKNFTLSPNAISTKQDYMNLRDKSRSGGKVVNWYKKDGKKIRGLVGLVHGVSHRPILKMNNSNNVYTSHHMIGKNHPFVLQNNELYGCVTCFNEDSVDVVKNKISSCHFSILNRINDVNNYELVQNANNIVACTFKWAIAILIYKIMKTNLLVDKNVIIFLESLQSEKPIEFYTTRNIEEEKINIIRGVYTGMSRMNKNITNSLTNIMALT